LASAAASPGQGAVAVPPAEPEPLRGGKLALAAFALALSNFVVVLDTTIANVSVPHIAGGLAVSPTQGTWVITSYAVADAITVPLTGWLAARFGTVRWFVTSLVCFGFFSFLCGMASSLSMLVLFRILQGLSGGPLMPLTQILLMRIFPKDKQGAGLGIWAMTTTAAPIIGPILGGLISDNWSWPWIFFINLPVVALCIFFALRLISPFETKTVKMPIDIVGLILLVVWVGAFQIMLDTGRENDWFNSWWITILALIAGIGLIAFLLWELTDRHPVVDVKVFRHRGFTFPSFAIALGFGAFFAQVVLTPLWLQQVLGYTATTAGYVVAWVGVFAVLGSPLAARFIGKVDLRIPATFGIVWLFMMTIMRTWWTSGADYWTLSIPHLLQGIGMPFFFIGLTQLALGSVPLSEVGSAAGIMSFLRTASGAIGTALATTAWDSASGTARSELVGNLNDPGGAMLKMQQAGMGVEQSRAALDRLVEVQASTLALAHVYWIAASVFVIAALAVWVAPKPKGRPAAGAAH
jgi:MFS transporter, DHA2 family, multidrug resistance protein